MARKLHIQYPGAILLLAMVLYSFAPLKVAKAETFGLDTLQLQYVEQEWGQPHSNRSVDGKPLLLGGKRFEHGLGTHANSVFRIALGGKAERFTATVGVDDEVGKQGSVVFKVTGDGKTLWESGVLHGGDPAKDVSVALDGVKKLVLSAGAAGDSINFGHANWADAKLLR